MFVAGTTLKRSSVSYKRTPVFLHRYR
jgi:hypothetical protein